MHRLYLRTYTYVESIRKKALGILANEHLLRDRAVLDSIGDGVTLVPGSGYEEEIGLLLQRVLFALPDGVEDLVELRDVDGPTLLLEGGTVLGVSVMNDESGAPWLLAGIATMVALEDGTRLPEESVNAVNARMPGMLFMERGGNAAFVNGAIVPLSDAGSEWARFLADLLVEVHSRAQRFTNEVAGEQDSDAVLRYWQAENMILDEEYHGDDASTAVAEYHAALPAGLRDLVRCRRSPAYTTLHIPFYRREGAERITLNVREVRSGEDADLWDLPGVHYLTEMGDDLSETEALARCRILNGEARRETGKERHTTSWLLGNWHALPSGEGGYRVLYHGYVSNMIRRHVDLRNVTAGVVRELWTSWDRIRLHQDFAHSVHGEMPDV